MFPVYLLTSRILRWAPQTLLKRLMGIRLTSYDVNQAVKKACGLEKNSPKKRKQVPAYPVPAYRLMRKEALIEEVKYLKMRLKNREKALAHERQRVEVLKSFCFLSKHF